MERRAGIDRPLPEPTVARLPHYLRIAEESVRAGSTTISSEDLARAAGINSAKVRKDLSLLGSLGTRGTGYDAESLIMAIDATLGVAEDWPVVIVGVGNLGRALVNAQGFFTGGYHLVGLVDASPALAGKRIGEVPIESFAELRARLQSAPSIGVIATPAAAAQDVADELVAMGVRSILNFAPKFLDVPFGVHIRYVDLSMELQILSYHATLSAEESSEATVSPLRGLDADEQGA